MFDMSWGEVLVIGAVALIVIGPKDLPKALRTVGNTVGKLRRMAGEFQSQFNEAMREAELDEIRRQVESANQSVAGLNQTGFNPLQTARDEIKGSIEAQSDAPKPSQKGADPAKPEATGAADPTPPAPGSATVILPSAPAAPVEAPRPTPDKPGSAAA